MEYHRIKIKGLYTVNILNQIVQDDQLRRCFTQSKALLITIPEVIGTKTDLLYG